MSGKSHPKRVDAEVGMRSVRVAGLILLAASVVGAQDGDLDSTFGDGGVGNVSTILYEDPRAVAVDTHGRVYAAFAEYNSGQTIYLAVVARLTAAGELDTTFDVDGLSTLALDVGGYDHATPNGLVVQPDGRIVVAGFASATGSPDQAALLYRLMPDGALDPSFHGDGILLRAAAGEDHHFIHPALNAAGEIVVSGYRWPAGEDRRTTVLRYSTTGALLQPFEWDVFPTGGEYPWSLVLEPTGRWVVAVSAGGDSETRVLRVAGGAPDPTFDGDGIAVFPGPEEPGRVRVARTEDGHYVVGSGYGATTTLHWLLPNGQEDPTACTVVPFCDYALAGFSDLAAQSDGRVVVLGTNNSGSDLRAARLLPGGAIDTAFGVAGTRTWDCRPGAEASDDYGVALALSGGRAVAVAGRDDGASVDSVCVTRLTALLIFGSGFEGGDTWAWSATAP